MAGRKTVFHLFGLVGCSTWGREESDTTERLHFHFSLSCIGEGNGNPLQCSCLENPGTGEPGGLPSMGSHRVGHDWSDLAEAASKCIQLYKCAPTWNRRSWKLLAVMQAGWAVPVTSCVTLRKLVNFSVPQNPHQQVSKITILLS